MVGRNTLRDTSYRPTQCNCGTNIFCSFRMAKTSNVYDVIMPLPSQALFSKDVFEFAIHNATKNNSPTVTLEGSIPFPLIPCFLT